MEAVASLVRAFGADSSPPLRRVVQSPGLGDAAPPGPTAGSDGEDELALEVTVVEQPVRVGDAFER
ncbi:hypothetical protein ACWGMA_49640, partial [Streptomyces asiaticus]